MHTLWIFPRGRCCVIDLLVNEPIWWADAYANVISPKLFFFPAFYIRLLLSFIYSVWWWLLPLLLSHSLLSICMSGHQLHWSFNRVPLVFFLLLPRHNITWRAQRNRDDDKAQIARRENRRASSKCIDLLAQSHHFHPHCILKKNKIKFCGSFPFFLSLSLRESSVLVTDGPWSGQSPLWWVDSLPSMVIER